MTMGFCWEGMEARFESLLREVAESRSDVTYMEIGLGHSHTLRAANDILVSTKARWRIVGIDTPQWIGDGLLDVCRQVYGNARVWSGGDPAWYEATIYPLFAEVALKEWTVPLDFVLIDGCHSWACTTADFLRVAPHVEPGGAVVFHDYSEMAQGGDRQPHCNAMIGVRDAVRDLGLADGTRPGWSGVEEVKGVGGNCIAIVRKL